MRLEQLEDRLALSTGTAALPGTALGPDPFKFGFDENGHAVYQTFNAATGQYNPPVRATSFVDGNGVLNYILPELVAPGDVRVVDPDGTSDLLRFAFTGAPGAPAVSVLQYFSDPGDTDLADRVGIPPSTTTVTVPELGPEGLNFFEYVAGPGNPATTNFYDGISDFTEST